MRLFVAGQPLCGEEHLARRKLVVPAQTVTEESVQKIASLHTPRERGDYTLRLWLSDAEGNIGAPITAPLAYECVRSEIGNGLQLSAGLGESATGSLVLRQGEASSISGTLQSPSGMAGAPLCVFAKVITDPDPQFLGIA